MPEVIVQAHPKGSATPGLMASLVTKDMADNLVDAAKVIGEAVAESVQIAARAGIDPEKEPFCVIVQFR